MFKDQKNAQKLVDVDNLLLSYHASLVKVMHDANNCNATLQGYFGATGDTAWSNPTTIYRCNGCLSDTTANYNAGNLPGRTAVISTNSYADPTQYWRITGIQIGRDHMNMGLGPNVTGKAVMRVTYQLNPRIKPGGGRSVSKDINLNLRFTQGGSPQFRECLSGQESSINNLQHDICTSMTQVASSGRIMQWNDATQSCESVGGTGASALKTCPSGTILEGVKTDGTVNCKAFASGVNPVEDLMLESPCQPGATIRLELVNGKVKTRCD